MIILAPFLFLSFLVYHNLYTVQFLQISPILTQSPEGTLCLFSFSSQSLYLLFPLVSPLKILYSKCLYKTYSSRLTYFSTLIHSCQFLTTPQCQCSLSIKGKAISNLCHISLHSGSDVAHHQYGTPLLVSVVNLFIIK